MHAGAVVLKAILDGDDDGISPVGLDGWSRELAVDRIDRSGHAVRSKRQVLHLEIVSDNSASIWPCGLRIAIDVVTTSPASAICGRVDAV